MNPCPLCQKPLTVFYSLTQMACVCQCDNAQCAMFTVTTSGDRQQEALDQFHGEALKVEHRADKAKAKVRATSQLEMHV